MSALAFVCLALPCPAHRTGVLLWTLPCLSIPSLLPLLLYSFLKQAINRHQIYEPWREGERDTQKGALLYSFLKQAINRHQIYKPRMAARVFMAILFFESKSRKQRVFIAFFFPKAIWFPTERRARAGVDKRASVGNQVSKAFLVLLF